MSLRALVASSVNIHGDQCLGFVDDNVASARQPHLALEGIIDLRLNTKAVEDWLRSRVELKMLLRPRRNLAHHFFNSLPGPEVIDDDRVDLIGKEIAHRPLDEIGLLEQASRSRQLLSAFLDLLPLLEQNAEVSDKITCALGLTDRADDDTHAIGNVELAENFSEPFSFSGIVDLSGDPALIIEGHEHQVATRQAHVGGDARPFVAIGPFLTCTRMSEPAG